MSEMDGLHGTPLGFLQISNLSAATGLTLPYGAQVASATSCSLAGKLLTVGGTVTGAFATGQIVVGTGVPTNTSITGPAGAATPTGWLLSQSCTTESGEAITAYQALPIPDYALITATGANVVWRDDGVAPLSTVGNVIEASAPEPWFYSGNLGAILFIQASGGAVLDVSFYKIAG